MGRIACHPRTPHRMGRCSAPLCRTHHRLKTHVPGWSHRKTGPTTYVWTTPHGHLYRVTQSGTEDITAELADTHEGDPAAA